MLKAMFTLSSAQRIKMITEGDLIKTFFFLAFPGILLVFIQAGMPVIDGLFIYNFDSEISGAAVSYVGSMQNVFITGAQGVAVAASAIIGQTNGEGDFEKAKAYAGQLMSISFLTGAIITPILVFSGAAITAGLDEALRTKVVLYNTVSSFSVPLILIYSSFSSIKTVFGHPEATFVRSLLFFPVKIFYMFIFVVILKAGVVGAALSAFFAYLTLAVFIVHDLFFKKTEERIAFTSLKIELPFFKRVFKVAWPTVLQSSTKSLSFFIVKIETSAYGDLALSAQGLSGDVYNMFQNLSCCYDAAIVSSVSINVGAGKGKRAKQFADFAIKTGLITSLFSAVACVFLSPYIIKLYTDNPDITQMAKWATIIAAVSFPAFSVMFNEMPAFTGLGMNKASLVIQTVRIWVVRLAALYALYFIFEGIGVYAVFISLSIANTVGGIISHIIYRRVRWVKGA